MAIYHSLLVRGITSFYICIYSWLIISTTSFEWFSSSSIRCIERLNLDGFEKLLALAFQKGLPVISVPKFTMAQRTATSIFSISLNIVGAVSCQSDTIS